MRSYVKLLIVLLPVALLAGCASPKVAKKPAPVEERTGVATSAPATSGVEVLAAPDQGSFAGEAGIDPLKDATGLLARRVIYFEYDSSEIWDEARAIVEAHAANLVKTSNLSVTLEGHADERGSREYNLALGERRAKAVQQLMHIKGVPAEQVRAVSFGEERPADAGHDEAAWSKNRRVELIYQ